MMSHVGCRDTSNEQVKNREKNVTEIVIMSHVGCNDTIVTERKRVQRGRSNKRYCNKEVQVTERYSKQEGKSNRK